MKNPFFYFFLLLPSLIFSQAVPLINNHCYGGSGNEERCFGAIDLPPGALLTGRTNSSDGDVTGFHGNEDGWLVRTDANGNVLWTHAYGGNDYECLFTSIATSDGGIVSVGYSKTITGDVTIAHGQRDFWVIKTDLLGNIIWQKSYGGSSDDIAYSVIEMPDSSYIVAGESNSIDGEVTGHHGTTAFPDVWVIHINQNNGNIIWEKSFGGSNYEAYAGTVGFFRSLSLIKSGDTTFAFTCENGSNDGDVQTNPTGSTEYWLVKVGLSGTLLFENSFGGSGGEASYNLAKTNDGGYIIVGGSGSNDGDITVHRGAVGITDYWIVKTDSLGNLQWQKTIGGTDYDDAFGVLVVSSGYYVLGRSFSANYDCGSAGFHGSSGNSEFFLALLDVNGNLQWKRDFGGTQYEEGYSVFKSSNGNIVCAGYAGSSDGDVLFQHGGFDFWMFSFADISSVEEQTPAENKLVVWPNPGNDFLNIDLGENFHHGELSIYNMQGSLIKNNSVDNLSAQISVADLDAGMYELILSDENGKRTHASWVKY